MNTFWMTFRLHENTSYDERYKNLRDGVEVFFEGGNYWEEPTSFILFQSSQSIDVIAADIKEAIDPRVDVVLLGMAEYKSYRVIGSANDQDVFKLLPLARRA